MYPRLATSETRLLAVLLRDALEHNLVVCLFGRTFRGLLSQQDEKDEFF
jgi:hypothetical protein